MDIKNIDLYTCEAMSAKVSLDHCKASHKAAAPGSICSVCENPLYTRQNLKPSGSFSLDRGLEEMEARTGVGINIIGALARLLKEKRVMDAGTPAHHILTRLLEAGFSKKEILEACEKKQGVLTERFPARELALLLQGSFFVMQRIIAVIRKNGNEPLPPEKGEMPSKSYGLWSRAMQMGFTRKTLLEAYESGILPYKAEKPAVKKEPVEKPVEKKQEAAKPELAREHITTLFSALCSREDESFLSRLGRVHEIQKSCRDYALETLGQTASENLSVSVLPAENGVFLEMNMEQEAAKSLSPEQRQGLYDVLAVKVCALVSASLARKLCPAGLTPLEDESSANPESFEEQGRARLLSILKASARFRCFGDMHCSFVPTGNVALEILNLAPRKDIRQWAVQALKSWTKKVWKVFGKALDNEVLDQNEQALLREGLCSGNLAGLFMSKAFEETAGTEVALLEESWEEMKALLARMPEQGNGQSCPAPSVSPEDMQKVLDRQTQLLDKVAELSVRGSNTSRDISYLKTQVSTMSESLFSLTGILQAAVASAEALTNDLKNNMSSECAQEEKSLTQQIQAISEGLPSGAELRIRPTFKFAESE